MPKRRLMWLLFSPYLVVIILAIASVTIYITSSMKKLYLRETADDLKARALLFRGKLDIGESIPGRDEADPLSKRFGRESETRFTVILSSGEVIGDTDEDPSRMENHADRPEISDAFIGKIGVSTRFSHTLGKNMMYVAVPMYDDSEIIGVVRASLPITAIDQAFSQIYFRVIAGGALAALIAGILSLYISRRISIPLERMKRGAERFSQGEFDHRLSPGNSLEMDALAGAMNRMASSLKEKILTIEGQRNELDAVLSSMIEGVLAFDASERLVSLNRAASEMLAIEKDKVKGQYLQEVIRNVKLQKLVSGILAEGKPLEDEMEIQDGERRIFQMHGTILRTALGESLGVLVVINDITHLRHLENVRRDFVANVSHELRTPITSIKGFVETLREGAFENPEETERFLAIIARQADRLNSIVGDLLSLSSIEESEKTEIRLEENKIIKVLKNAMAVCDTKARVKKITMELVCDEGQSALINPDILEQAVINLLDNAIKYSHEGGKVIISAASIGNKIIISIQDWGIGIEKKHLSRLFERFYTVDKARSRELGGTGLGLAIVRHIALAHHGKVTVESQPGKGSVFSIHLPAI